MTPLKAIREKCLDCCGGSAHEVKICQVTRCSLHPFRLGHNPNRKGLGNKNFLSSLHDSATNSGRATKRAGAACDTL